MNILRDVAQYPEERSFDWKNVAVARRKALRGRPALAIQCAPIASSATKCALRRATSPHVFGEDYSHLGRHGRRENAVSCLQDMTGLFDMLIKQ